MTQQLSTDQLQTVIAIQTWFNYSLEQQFILEGAGGTGKTSVVSAIIKALGLGDGEFICCAFTGKACSVLRSKGLYARTIHKSLFTFNKSLGNTAVEKIMASMAKLDADDTSGEYERLKKMLRDNEGETGIMTEKVKLIVVDECSMVSSELKDAILKTEVKVLWVGDEKQALPLNEHFSPVMKGAKFSVQRLSLTTQHRFAEDTALFRQMGRLRKGLPMCLTDTDDSFTIVRDGAVRKGHDMVLAHKNSTVNNLNYESLRIGFPSYDCLTHMGKMMVTKNCYGNNAVALGYEFFRLAGEHGKAPVSCMVKIDSRKELVRGRSHRFADIADFDPMFERLCQAYKLQSLSAFNFAVESGLFEVTADKYAIPVMRPYMNGEIVEIVQYGWHEKYDKEPRFDGDRFIAGFMTALVRPWGSNEHLDRVRVSLNFGGICGQSRYTNMAVKSLNGRTFNDFYLDDKDPRGSVLSLKFVSAMTIHKSQGSEWEDVAVVNDSIPSDLMYTAISRAKKKVTLYLK